MCFLFIFSFVLYTDYKSVSYCMVRCNAQITQTFNFQKLIILVSTISRFDYLYTVQIISLENVMP